jgi:hypothetical protein
MLELPELGYLYGPAAIALSAMVPLVLFKCRGWI